MSRSVPLLHVTRGGVLESAHWGALVVVEGDTPVLVRGDPEQVVFYRSTSKPIQALVGITSGAADAFGFDDEEIALAAGSHSTRPEHVAVARRMLQKAGLDEGALQCGGHWAYDEATRRDQQAAGETPIPVWSNCSGKHSMMLAAAKHLGLDLDSYLAFDHPVQVEIRRHVALLCGIDVEAVRVAVDGCSAPAFAVPLGGMAHSLAKLADPQGLPDDVAAAVRRVGRAMHAHPTMVGGPGRFDTDLMTSSKAVLLAKAGAEGVHGVAAPARRLGVAIKVEDGSDRGYRLVMLHLLEHLGLLTAAERADIASRQCDPVLKNRADTAVGTLEVVVNPLA